MRRGLFQLDRERYGKRAWDTALEALAMPSGTANHGPIADWLVANFGVQSVPVLVDYLKRGEIRTLLAALDEVLKEGAGAEARA